MGKSYGMPARRCSSQSSLSVALIDDDAGQLNFLKAQFANLGAAVTTFASGLDFLNRGCSPQEKVSCWDLVVVDYVMPVLNGIETIASFTSEMLLHTKVCLLSGNAIGEEGQHFLDDLGLSSFQKTPQACRDIWHELSRPMLLQKISIPSKAHRSPFLTLSPQYSPEASSDPTLLSNQAKEPTPEQTEMSPEEKESLTQILMTSKLFSGLNHSQLARVLGAFEVDWAVPGQLITKEGDNWPYFCAIIAGRVQVSRTDKGIMGAMEAGRWFGHFRRSPLAMATVLSLERTLISRISSHDFDVACRPNPDDKWLLNSGSQVASSATRNTTEHSSLYDFSIDRLMFDPNMIGSGSFAQVYRCQTQDGKVHAVKCISKSTVVRQGGEKQTMNEVALLSVLSHQFIVHLDKVMQDRHCIYLLMEFVPGGEFFRHLQVRGTISEAEAQFYVANVALGLEHMHNENIIFRDLKPENLVFGSNGYLKMVDLGFSKRITGMTFTLCGTPDYISPEIVANKGHGKPVDFWSLGILLYEMLTGKTPYSDDDSNVYKIYEQIIQGHLMFPVQPRLDSEVRAFIGSLLTIDPKRRLGGYDGLDLRNHQWLKRTDWAKVRDCEVQAPHEPEDTNSPNCISSYSDLIASMTHTPICDIWNPLF